ncbi:hypothetical protein BH11PSE11_BH11PSE11_04200 [soil metagenome]
MKAVVPIASATARLKIDFIVISSWIQGLINYTALWTESNTRRSCGQ